jgi:transposase
MGSQGLGSWAALRPPPADRVAEPSCRPLTPRWASWLVLRRAEQHTVTETQQLAQLHMQSAEVAEAITLAQDFAILVRQRQPEALDSWLRRATTSELAAIRRFALRLGEDYAAVKAGVTCPGVAAPWRGTSTA